MRAKSLPLLIGFVMGTALAGTAQKPPERRYFKASNPSLEQQGLPVPYSDAVLVGNTMYVAGRTGIDPKSGPIPQDVEQEIRFLLDSFKITLAKGGMTTDDVVMVQVHCPDLSLYNKFNAVTSLTFRRNFLQGRSWGPGRYWAEHISRCWESR